MAKRGRKKSSNEAATTPVAASPSPGPANLESLRAQIDAVDARIHELLNERARLARQVGVSKHADGHTVDFYRPERGSALCTRPGAPSAPTSS